MQYFQNICLYDSKINGFKTFQLRTFLSFYIPYHIRKISICLQTLINTRKIKGSECGSKSRQIEHLFLSILRTKIITLKPL